MSGLRIVRAASTGAFASLWIFLLGWVWAASGSVRRPDDQSPVASVAAVGIGSLCAFVAGAISGAIIAHGYNLAGRVFGD